jgi:hypothetical protein
MLRRYIGFVLAVVALQLFASASQADLLHEGDNDPQTEGWSRNGTVGVADNTGKPNWRHTYGSGSNYYRQIGSWEKINGDWQATGNSAIEQLYEDPTGWTATYEIHLLEAAHLNEAVFVTQDATNHFHIQLYDGLGVHPKGAYAYWQKGKGEGDSEGIFADTAVQLGNVDPTDGFHTYQIVLDPGTDTGILGRNDDIISYYIDGVKELEMPRSELKVTGDRAEMITGRFGGANNPGSDAAASTDFLNALTRLQPGMHPIDPIGPPPGSLVGDYNNSGTVDAADYTLYRDNLGLDSSALQNNDIAGTIDIDHYAQWSENFGNTAGAGSSATVPEPCSCALVTLGLLAWLARRPRQ